MGLFKSKAEKEMNQRLLIKKTMNQIQKHIKELEAQKLENIDIAKQAKLKGSTSQYNLAISGLKMTMTQQKKAEEMLLNFRLVSQMRDLTKMTAGFLDGMSMLSKEMTKTTKNMDFVKVQKEFETAMMGVEDSSEKLDLMLDGSESMYSGIASNGSAISDQEIDNLVTAQASAEEASVDQEIEKKMAEIEKSLKA
ncbi:MAG: hypothetical protein RR454_06875 [Clostridia bacterium]